MTNIWAMKASILLLGVALISHSAHAQTPLPPATEQEPDPAVLDYLSWLEDFYLNTTNSAFNVRRSSMAVIATGEGAYDLFAFDLNNFSPSISPIGACNLIERYDLPLLDIPDADAVSIGLASVRNWLGIFVVTTGTGYSGVVIAMMTDFNYVSVDETPLLLTRMLPLDEFASVQDAQAAVEFWGSPFSEELAAISICSGMDPNTPMGRYCKCIKDAKDEAVEKQLAAGAVALLGGPAVCIAGLACGPFAPLCIGGCAVATFGGFGLYTAANVYGFHSDMYTCSWNLCAEEPLHCPP